MARLILLLMLFAALTLAVAAAATALRALRAPPHRTPTTLPATTEDRMPQAMRNMAYVVLLLLLTGLTSGWLGPSLTP